MVAIDPARFTKVYDLTGDGKVDASDVNREFAIRFAKQAPKQRVGDIAKFTPAVRAALSRELTAVVLDPRREAAGPTEGLKNVPEGQNGRVWKEIKLSGEALKTLTSTDAKALDQVISSLVNRKTSSNWAGTELIDVLEYAYHHGGARGKILDGLKMVANSNRYAESYRAFLVLHKLGIQGYEELPPSD